MAAADESSSKSQKCDDENSSLPGTRAEHEKWERENGKTWPLEHTVQERRDKNAKWESVYRQKLEYDQVGETNI